MRKSDVHTVYTINPLVTIQVTVSATAHLQLVELLQQRDDLRLETQNQQAAIARMVSRLKRP